MREQATAAAAAAVDQMIYLETIFPILLLSFNTLTTNHLYDCVAEGFCGGIK